MAQGLAGAVGLWFPTGATPISLLCAQISHASSCGNFFVRATPTSALMLNLPLIHFFHACNYCRCAHAQSPSDLLVRHLPQAARGINFAKSCLGDDDWSWRVWHPEWKPYHRRMENQTCLEKAQPNKICWMFSSSWSHKGLRLGCGSPLCKPASRPTSIVWKDIFIAIRQLFLPHWSASYILLNKLKLNFFLS